MKGIIKFAIGLTVGALYGLTFAQKSGKRFRGELRKSENPLELLWEEIKSVNEEAYGTAEKSTKNSYEKVRKLAVAKSEDWKEFINNAKKQRGEDLEQVKDYLLDLAKNAEEAAKEIGSELEKKGEKLIASAKKKISHRS